MIDLGDPGKDNDFGSGLAQLFDAAGSIVPTVTPVLEPYAQAIDPGGSLFFQLSLVNNTGVEQQFFRRMDVHFNGNTVTVAGPGDFKLDPDEIFTRNWHFKPPASASDISMQVELVLETASGDLISSTAVEAYIRP